MTNNTNIYWAIVKDYDHSEDPTRKVGYVLDESTIYPAKTDAEDKLLQIYNKFFKQYQDGKYYHVKSSKYNYEKNEFVVKYYKTTVRYHITALYTDI